MAWRPASPLLLAVVAASVVTAALEAAAGSLLMAFSMPVALGRGASTTTAWSSEIDTAAAMPTSSLMMSMTTASSFVGANGLRGSRFSSSELQKRRPPSARRAQQQSYGGDEFKAARDKIRRIQLGLGANDPMPPEEGEAPPALTKEEEELAAAGDVNATSDITEEDVVDAFAGSQKDMFKADDAEMQQQLLKKKKTEDPSAVNFLLKLPGELASDINKVTTPSVGEVIQTFGIVILLCVLYTGFIAVVDFSAQAAFSQVFSEWYRAARPDASGGL